MNINESNLPKEKLFFHGSRYNNKLLKLNPPSPQNIFFVTADLDYADMYAFEENNGPNIYVISLNNNAKVFKAWDWDDRKKLDYPEYVKEFLSYENHFRDPIDIFNRFVDLARNYKLFKKYNMNWNEFFYKYIQEYSIDNETEMDLSNQFQSVKFFEKRDASIFTSENPAKKLREIFCEDLKNLGFQMFATQEASSNSNDKKINRHGDSSYSMSKKKYAVAKSANCYGIFDVNGLDSLIPIPLKKKEVEDALKELKKNYDAYDKDRDYGKDYNSSNALLKLFLSSLKTE